MRQWPRTRFAGLVSVTLTLPLLVGCDLVLQPSPTPTPEPAASATPVPEVTASASPTATEEQPSPSPSPEPTLSLELPEERDGRQVRVSVAPELPVDGDGRIIVTVTNLSAERIDEIVLRWPTGLDAMLFLAPFQPSSDRIRDGGPPLVQDWTRWVEGPGEQGEPAGTTSLGYGPMDPGMELQIVLFATRRAPGQVEFDLHLLAGDDLLVLESGAPAALRVAAP